MTAAYLIVLATEHPVRDEWVDEQARNSPVLADMIPVEDRTYQGVWRLPLPERTPVHLFVLPEDMEQIRAHSGMMPVADE